MYDILSIEESSGEKEALAKIAKVFMEGVLRLYIGKYISFDEMRLFCKEHKVIDLEILLMAWRMLIREHQNKKTFIVSDDITFGKTKPLVMHKEIFIKGEFVLHIGLRLVE
jgi:hypothetical protein